MELNSKERRELYVDALRIMRDAMLLQEQLREGVQLFSSMEDDAAIDGLVADDVVEGAIKMDDESGITLYRLIFDIDTDEDDEENSAMWYVGNEDVRVFLVDDGGVDPYITIETNDVVLMVDDNEITIL